MRIVMMKLQIVTLVLICSSFCTAQKRVLVEKFTNAYCGACPNGTIILEGYQEKYPGLILVKHHKPVTWIDNPLPNPASAVIRTEVGVWGQPTAMVDRKAVGTDLVLSSGAWEDRIIEQLNRPYYMNLDLSSVSFDAGSRILEFNIEMLFDELPEAEELRLSVMVVEDHVYGVEQHNYSNDTPGHPLEGQGDIIWGYEHNAVTRMILDQPWGTDVAFPADLEIGVPYVQTFTYLVPEEYVIEHMKLVALVAEHDDANVYARTILNADEYSLSEELDLSSTSHPSAAIDFDLSPNPTTELLTVEFQNVPEEVYLFDSRGITLLDFGSPAQRMDISVAQMNAGTYTLVIKTQDGQLVAKKFSKI